MNIKHTIKKAGLLVKEFSVLCGVSRISVHVWMIGGNINPLRQAKVEKIVAAIDAAVRAGDLPLDVPDPSNASSGASMKRIQAIVIKHLKTLSK